MPQTTYGNPRIWKHPRTSPLGPRSRASADGGRPKPYLAWWQQAGLFSTVFPRAVLNEKQLARIAARRDFVQRELATRPPSGKKRPGVRREVASKRSRGASGHFAPSAVTASAAVVAQPAAAIAVSATAVSVATTAAVAEPAAAAAAAALAVAAFAVAPPRRAEVEKASPPATLVVSLAERPQLHGLIPRDVDACRAIVAEQTERIARMVNGF